jgi:hypothetical protein
MEGKAEGPPDCGRGIPGDHGTEKAYQIAEGKTQKEQPAHNRLPRECANNAGDQSLSKRNASNHEVPLPDSGVLGYPEGQHDVPCVLAYLVGQDWLGSRARPDRPSAAVELGAVPGALHHARDNDTASE